MRSMLSELSEDSLFSKHEFTDNFSSIRKDHIDAIFNDFNQQFSLKPSLISKVSEDSYYVVSSSKQVFKVRIPSYMQTIITLVDHHGNETSGSRMEHKFCSQCGVEIQKGAKYCHGCGGLLQQNAASLVSRSSETSNVHLAPANQELTYADSPYYQSKFKMFDAQGGGFVASWNWAACLFGIIWYFSKGMTAKALVYLFASAIVGAIFALIGLPLFLLGPIFLGMVGNYDYYLIKKHGKQLW